MKSPTLFLVSIIVLSVFTSPSSSTLIHTVVDDLVLDYDGNPLEKGVGYSIVLPGSGALGGTVLVAPPLLNNETCEAEVYLVRVLPTTGTSLTFTPVNDNEDVIRLGSPLAIQSLTPNPGCESTVWKATAREGLGAIITTGGIINSGPSCFRIATPQPEIRPNVYMFQYTMCGFSNIWPIGTIQSESSSFAQHLALQAVNPVLFYIVRDSDPLPCKK